MRLMLDVANIDEIFDDMGGLEEGLSKKTKEMIFKSLDLSVMLDYDKDTLEDNGDYIICMTVFGLDKMVKLSDILIKELK